MLAGIVPTVPEISYSQTGDHLEPPLSTPFLVENLWFTALVKCVYVLRATLKACRSAIFTTYSNLCYDSWNFLDSVNFVVKNKLLREYFLK